MVEHYGDTLLNDDDLVRPVESGIFQPEKQAGIGDESAVYRRVMNSMIRAEAT